MEERKTFYITTTLPYVNANPHVGFAMEMIRADVIARYKEAVGYEVFFNTGTDEHGQKIYEKAQKEGLEIKEYVEGFAERFRGLQKILDLSDRLNFIRTTDDQHIKAAQEFWNKCNKKGFIYKKQYQTKYCVGCELEKTDSELENGKCPIHPGEEIQLIDEENYFFKFSAFRSQLLEFYTKHKDFVVPDFRFNEIKKFVEGGLNDFSISRLVEKMPWGIPVPDDKDHVMYVWFDALVNYISALGWPDDVTKFEKFWILGNPTQYAGKDNLRQQSAMWQAMLMAAGIPNSSQIIINGFINAGDGRKMSKSLGNVINPYDIVSEYGTDALRYYLLRHVHNFEDTSMSMEKFHEAYIANLVNGLGNLVSRIMNMVVVYGIEYDLSDANKEIIQEAIIKEKEYQSALEKFEINQAMDYVWKLIGEIDNFIQTTEPFKKIKTNEEEAKLDISKSVSDLYNVALLLTPLLPVSAGKILQYIKNRAKPEIPLFPRIEK